MFMGQAPSNVHAYLVQHNEPFIELVKEKYFESMFGKVEWDEICT